MLPVVALTYRAPRFPAQAKDPGGASAISCAMDHPEAVTHLVVMDGLPVIEHLERTDARFARVWWHWWFLGQTDKPAERVICLDPDAWYSTPSPADDDLDIHGNPADIWAPWLARPLRHRTIDSGHHQAEQAPDAVADALLDFLADTPPQR
jgi:haloacetate dehalogenase